MKRSVSANGLFTVLCLAFSVFLGPLGRPSRHGDAQLLQPLPANHKHSILAEQWCQEISKRTNGKVKITMYHGAR